MGNRLKLLKAIFIIGLLLNIGTIYGQQKKGIEYSGFFDTYYYRGPINFTAAGGLTSFNGDICKLFDCNSWYASIGASYQVWPRTYFGAEVSLLNFTGKTDEPINYQFTAQGLHLEAFGRFLLLDKTVTRHGQLKDRPYRIRPYIQTGFGVYHTIGRPNSLLTNELLADSTADLTNVASNHFQPIIFTVPVGLGFQIWLSHRFSIMPEVFYRFALSDQLDGISLNTDKLGMDSYATVGLKIQYTPQAPRVRTKKKTLTPPEEYTGPKGTDYPRKNREEKPANNNEPLPDDQSAPQEGTETPQEGNETPQGNENDQNQDGWEQTEPQEGDKKKTEPEPKKEEKENDGWGW